VQTASIGIPLSISIAGVESSEEAAVVVRRSREFVRLVDTGYVYQRMITADDNSPPTTLSNIDNVARACIEGRPLMPIGLAKSVGGKVMTFAVDLRIGKKVAYIQFADRG